MLQSTVEVEQERNKKDVNIPALAYRPKILVLSELGEFGNTIRLLEKEDLADYTLYIDKTIEPDILSTYDGMICKKLERMPNPADYDIVIIDGFPTANGLPILNSDLRDKGVAYYIAPSATTYAMENDREAGFKVMREFMDIKVLPHESFDSIGKCIEFVKKGNQNWAFKPGGQECRHLTTVCDSKEELISNLEHLNKKYKWKADKFTLQLHAKELFKDTECEEVGISAFFNGEDIVGPFQVSFEHKRLVDQAGGHPIGINVGEMGTSMYWTDDCRLAQMVFTPAFLNFLREEDYRGDMAINCMASKFGVVGLEFTARWGWPALDIQNSSVRGGLSCIFSALAFKEPYYLPLKDPYSVGVVIVGPFFPFMRSEGYKHKNLKILLDNKTITDLNSIPDWLSLSNVRMVDGEVVLVSDNGYMAVVTGTGTTMESARKKAYEFADRIRTYGSWYRTDIGEKTQSALDNLKSWGLI